MTEPKRADELIEKYFDDLLAPEELAELERLLVSDPSVARRFTRVARTDSFLYSHFNQCRAEQALGFERAAEPARAAAEVAPVPVRPRFGLRNFLEHFWGPTASVVIHVALIALIVRLAVMSTTEKPPQMIEVAVVEPEAPQRLDEFKKEFDQLEEPPQEMPAVASPAAVQPANAPAAELAVADHATSAGVVGAPIAPAAELETRGLEMKDDSQSVLVMRGLFVGRSAGGRAKALESYGAKWGPHTEASVLKSLEWLKNHQDSDGSWGPNKPAMTGLALLTYLAHGETTSSKKYGPTVERAIRFLVSQQGADGRFAASPTGSEDSGDPAAYAHGIATYAISEAYGLTRIPSLKPAMEKAVQAILDGQQPKGGWNYRFTKSARRDTSVSGWMIQALESAAIAGAENAHLHDAIESAVADMKSVHDPKSGRFGYTDSGGGSLGCTGIGVLCLQLAGHGMDKEARQGLAALKDARIEWSPETEKGWPLYEWYYITQAKFHQGGQTWSNWNAQFARIYVKMQAADGSWPAASRTEAAQGPVYSTALAALTLQVYYRFLPTYKSAEPRVSGPADTNDVVVRYY